MPIKFTNIRNGETRTVDTEPLIAAFYNSSDQGPNSHEGQDFGWRLAPETIKELRAIKADRVKMNTIAATFQIPLEDVRDSNVLRYMSLEEARKKSAEDSEESDEHRRKYEDDLRALEDEDNKAKKSSSKSKK